jgi:prophage regulatory protein
MYLNHINYCSEVSDMYHNIRDIAERFGVVPSTIWRWVKDGFFPRPYKFGPGTTRWRDEDIRAFEAKSATRS